MGVNRSAEDYVIRVLSSPLAVNANAWNQLLSLQPCPTPFMRHEYLCALHQAACAVPQTGWTPRWIVLEQQGELAAAAAVYLKTHSYGEYVFDWAWAQAFEQHGLSYYPKAVAAVPFTPVPGTRLLARDASARQALAAALVHWAQGEQLSSLHVLFTDASDLAACTAAGLMTRQAVQFHWHNSEPGYRSFEHFLESLTQEKRKKIRQERRKVAQAGVRFRWARGADIRPADWQFFYRCYERTYLEHGNSPYLSPAFFETMAALMADNWLLFVAEREGEPIASSLIALNPTTTRANGQLDAERGGGIAYGRYWGALERVDCLHFEACYYQPLAWCIARKYLRFEGGAQGEHKMARGLLPARTFSAHWLRDNRFHDAIAQHLAREGRHMDAYVNELNERSPFRSDATAS